MPQGSVLAVFWTHALGNGPRKYSGEREAVRAVKILEEQPHTYARVSERRDPRDDKRLLFERSLTRYRIHVWKCVLCLESALEKGHAP